MPEFQLLHDGAIDIAIGKNRKETAWKNKEFQWSQLVNKVSSTTRTAETYNEYCSSNKPRQDEIKDIGGFVGGYLSGGRRKASSVLHRQLVTLDIDHTKNNAWDLYKLFYDNAGCAYSTHKHEPAAPRLRILLPLDREVASDEYVAISRRIAGNLGIENFDHTTFEPSRLMYWPSTSKDGVFFFDYQDGPWLSADAILRSYTNWQDSSEWPVSERYNAVLQRAIKKQGDPLEKTGVVGAWCRTYSVTEAILTFLKDEYAPCDTEDRYTYVEGSTSGGLVLYDDKYAFSHHGTDPVSGKLCNAFDLVRIHKFGLKDEDARDDTPSNRLPSYEAMVEFATKDKSVRKLIGVEKLAQAKADFWEITGDGELESAGASVVDEPDTDWLADLQVDKRGDYYSTIDNCLLILNNDPYLKGGFGMDLFERRPVALRNLPWRDMLTGNDKYLTDIDDAGLRHYIEKNYSIGSGGKVKDALDIVLAQNAFHPVRQYLMGLRWDGEDRISTLLQDYLGVADNEYTRTVARKTLAAAVTRIFRPGVKFEYVLTFVGKQGTMKSSLIDKLGKQWFSDSFSTVSGKEAYEQLQGVWLIEVAELSAFRKAEVESIKHFIAKRVDRYRSAYAVRPESHPRQQVFFATTNKTDFLQDSTGNRRWWPVRVREQEPTKNVLVDLTDEEVDQVWAQAVQYYNKGEKLFLTPEIEAMAFDMQQAHMEVDSRHALIREFLEMKLPAGDNPITDAWDEKNSFERHQYFKYDRYSEPGTVKRRRVCVAEIWCECFGGVPKDMTAHNTKFIHEFMRNLPGWRSSSMQRYHIYGRQRGYEIVEKYQQI